MGYGNIVANETSLRILFWITIETSNVNKPYDLAFKMFKVGLLV